MGVVGALFWVGESGWKNILVVGGGEWGIILDGLGCMGKYSGWLVADGVNGVGWDEWRWVHCFIIPFQHGLIPTVNKPTHVKRNIVSAIDHMITNTVIGDELKTGIMNTDISTGLPMFFIFKGVVFS